MQFGDRLVRFALNDDRLDLAEVLVLDLRLARVGREQVAAGRRHEDAGEVSGVVEPGAVQVVLWAGRPAAVQLQNTRTYALYLFVGEVDTFIFLMLGFFRILCAENY